MTADLARPLSILVYGRARQDTAERHCVTALRQMGHHVEAFDPDVEPLPMTAMARHPRWGRFARKLQHTPLTELARARSLVARVRRERPDLLLVLALNALAPETVTAVDAAGTPVVGWYQDHMVNFERHRFLLAPYRALFFKDPHIVERLRGAAGLSHVHYLPEACEPGCQRSLEPSAEDRRRYGCDVLIYGNLYPYRARIIESLAGLDVKFFGQEPAYWMDHPSRKWWAGSALELDTKARALACARVVVSTSHFGEVRSANARIFETAGIGAFQLADAPGTAEFFVPDEEIVTFLGPRQLRERVEHFLPRDADRMRIGRAGQRPPHRDHTFVDRLGKLLAVAFPDRASPTARAPS